MVAANSIFYYFSFQLVAGVAVPFGGWSKLVDGTAGNAAYASAVSGL